MKETSKAMERRWKEKDFPWEIIFSGYGIDVGCGDDRLDVWKCIPFNLPDGGGDDLGEFFPPPPYFDFIHGSQILEHAINPKVMLQSWVSCVKPEGYIVATVPDWELYEGKIWPSRFSEFHKSTWSIEDYHADYKLPEWLQIFDVDIMRCKIVDTNYDYNIGANIDQTRDPEKGVEAFIEIVLRKHADRPNS